MSVERWNRGWDRHMVGGDSECKEVEPWGAQTYGGQTVSVERWNHGGHRHMVGGDSKCREVEPWGAQTYGGGRQ